MNPLYEHLNEELERQDNSIWSSHTSPDLLPSLLSASDQEVNELVALARHIQLASAVQVDSDFAEKLEQKMLVHNAMQRLQLSQRSWWNRLSPRRLMRTHPVFAVALTGCLLLVLLTCGILMVSSQVTNPNNPLYALNQWEQNVRISLSGSPAGRATLDLQFANDRLNTLTDLTNLSDAQAYEQQLEKLDQQIKNAVQSINQVPAGAQRDQLKSRLATFEIQARQVLRGLLPRLALVERLATTVTLADLGGSVPHLQNVQFISPSHPGGQTTIIITGSDLELGAHLVIDGQVMGVSGSLQNGVYTYMVCWNGNGKQQSYNIGILNPDGTFAQITILGPSGSGGSGSGNSCGSVSSKSKGNGNSKSKGNGNSKGKGSGNSKGKGSGNSNSKNRIHGK
ncbi:MAG: DUF5667 domain-containing protein [Ktedonobacteraceae bacterium]